MTSPTFTLVRQYRCPGPVRQLVHADVYRLESLAEVADLGLVELAEPALAHEGAVVLVEWGDAAAPALGDELADRHPAVAQRLRTTGTTTPGTTTPGR